MLHDALGHFLFPRTIGPRNELQKEQCHKEEAFSNTSRVCIELRMRGSGPLQSIPHFDRLVYGSGNDGLSVRGEGDRVDVMTVGVLLGRLDLQCT